MDREREEHDLSIHEDQEIVFTAEHSDDLEDRMQMAERIETAKSKGKVVLVAGCSACLTVSTLAIMEGWSKLNGGAGIGIDLNHILLAYLAGLGLIYRWAFPPKDKN